jgi:phage baseplate assembly protein W
VNEPLVGLAFPFRILPTRARAAGEDPNAPLPAGVARSVGFEKVEDDVRHLLSVRLGERPMLRGYGGGVHPHRQDPNDETLSAIVRHEIELALRTFMPDVELTSPLEMTIREEELTVAIDYRATPGDVVRTLALGLG